MYSKTIIVGRLTADPELKQTPNGVSVTSFSIAVNRSYADKTTGERQADFLDIVAWRGTAEFICKYFAKGRTILIEGSIQTRSYVDKQGQNRRVWEIVAEQARFVESKQNGGANTGASSPSPESRPAAGSSASAPSYVPDQAEDYTEIDDDGDLPF